MEIRFDESNDDVVKYSKIGDSAKEQQKLKKLVNILA